jgi:hypothetical protein
LVGEHRQFAPWVVTGGLPAIIKKTLRAKKSQGLTLLTTHGLYLGAVLKLVPRGIKITNL